MIEGIIHITFIVNDLKRAAIFFREIFNATKIYSIEDVMFSISREIVFIIEEYGIAIMEGESLVECTYNQLSK